jgi:hypothetical protein
LVLVSTDLTTKSLSEMTPVEVDTELFRIYNLAMTVESRIAGEVKFIERMTKRAEKAPLSAWDQRNYEEAKARLVGYQEQRRAYIAEKAPFDVEFIKRGGWLRYYRVTNGNGHVHREMECRTCFPTTAFAWEVELADCDEAAMVTEFGEKACTVCFPDAPALPSFNGPGRRNREAQDARAAERQAKAEAKAAKAITTPDGTPLKVVRFGRSERLDTERAARIEASDLWLTAAGHVEDKYTTPERVAEAQVALGTIVGAIAAKHGLSTDEVLADMQPAFDRKLKTWRKECAEAQRRFGSFLGNNGAAK